MEGPVAVEAAGSPVVAQVTAEDIVEVVGQEVSVAASDKRLLVLLAG